MNTGVRIIKRECIDGGQSAPLSQAEKTGQQREREIANTVKNWIAESAQRRGALRNIALWSTLDNDANA